MAAYFLYNGIAESTRLTYTTPQRSLHEFTAAFGITEGLPPSELTICLWMAWLALRPVRYSTIRTYLYGVRSLCVDFGAGDPLKGNHRIHRVLRGIKRDQGANSGLPPKLPVTFDLLRRIRSVVDPNSAADRLHFAAIATAVSGLFRIGELTVTRMKSADEQRRLRLSNLGWKGAYFDVTLLASKTDPFREGVTVHVLHPIAVRAMALYLTQRSTALQSGSFLFADGHGQPLSRSALLAATKAFLSKAGVPTSGYSGLSFRRGGATSLANAGVPDRLIKTLGRWRSWAYEVYIETSIDQLKAAILQL